MIKHFHFKSWNNFGVPKNLSHFLSFIRIIHKWNKSFESKKVSVLIDFLITHTVTFLTHAKIIIVSVWNFIANNLLKHRFLIPFSFRNQSVVRTERAHTHLCTAFNVPPETLTITFGCHNCFYFTKWSLNITDSPVNISLECSFTKPLKCALLQNLWGIKKPVGGQEQKTTKYQRPGFIFTTKSSKQHDSLSIEKWSFCLCVSGARVQWLSWLIHFCKNIFPKMYNFYELPKKASNWSTNKS